MSDKKDFRFTDLPVVGKTVLRLGIAGNYGLTADDARWAADQGANYWAWNARMKITPALRDLLKSDRDRHVVGMYGMGGWGSQVCRSVEKALKVLNTDYIDIFKLGWLGRTSRYSEGIVEALLRLKEVGKILSIGTSIHDRVRAGKLARDSAIDLFMLRYNAKHPGAEQGVFPHLSVRRPAVVAYTATSWRQLLRPIKHVTMPPWPGKMFDPSVPPLTPGLCYRFCLTSPHVHIVLTGPKNRLQLQENLEALNDGPLSDNEMAWVRDYGRKVKATKKFDYLP